MNRRISRVAWSSCAAFFGLTTLLSVLAATPASASPVSARTAANSSSANPLTALASHQAHLTLPKVLPISDIPVGHAPAELPPSRHVSSALAAASPTSALLSRLTQASNEPAITSLPQRPAPSLTPLSDCVPGVPLDCGALSTFAGYVATGVSYIQGGVTSYDCLGFIVGPTLAGAFFCASDLYSASGDSEYEILYGASYCISYCAPGPGGNPWCLVTPPVDGWCPPPVPNIQAPAGTPGRLAVNRLAPFPRSDLMKSVSSRASTATSGGFRLSSHLTRIG